MRSIFSVILVVALIASAFTGCGVKKADTKATPTPAPTATVIPKMDKADKNTDNTISDALEDGLVEDSPLADDGVAEPAKNG